MSGAQQYQRDKNGIRFQMGGMNTVLPPDLLPPGKSPYLQNVRSYLQGRIKGRATQTSAVNTISGAVNSLRRLNDTTPAGPASGYALISGSQSGFLYCNNAGLVTGLSGNPLALIPFRPNSSPQPWMYVGDSSQSTHIVNPSFDATGMLKVRSDGLTYKMGVKEPQDSPSVGTETTTTSGTDILPVTAFPWTNEGGANSGFNFGHTDPPGTGGGQDGSLPVRITGGSGLTQGSVVTLVVTGSATVNGATHSPGDGGSTASGFPGAFTGSGAAIVVGAFTDASGNVVTSGVFSIGSNAVLTVPVGATQLQVGINSMGNTFNANSGTYSVNWQVQASAIATQISTLGEVTAYVWGDSPHSSTPTFGIATYIWKNPNDTGSGIPRSIGDAAVTVTNNSWQFDSSPENGTVPVDWDTLASDGTVSGSIPLFTPALESNGYQDFNVCVVGNIFVPAAGTYTFDLQYKDQIMLGVGGGASGSLGNPTGTQGQTISVVSALPLLFVGVLNGGGTTPNTASVNITFPGPGAYPIEIDWDYWDKDGRSLIMTVDGQPIIPLSSGAKTNVTYRYTYRSSLTGATSNPSPESVAQVTPVFGNTVTPEFSNDPQVDKVDYYRMDDGLDNFTYVGTGPNTNPPTAFTDSLLDADVIGNPLLSFANYEPFPSIDLPKGGQVNVTGNIATWIGGDQFNMRWLPGTIILIGGVATTLYNRPSSATQLRVTDAADGTTLSYEISEPILAAQPMASMFGDTDNTLFAFAVQDPLRPGTLVWCNGNNLDSASDTNSQDVTSPSDALVNGVIANGIGMVFSAENGWIIYPNFTSALATVNGTEGNPFSLIRAGVTRGLYIRPCIATDGSGTFFYRSKDGIEMSSGGGKQTSLTDADLFNLFPHEGYLPKAITVADFTVQPPDDTLPEQQSIRFATGYLYYNYRDITGGRTTIVFDVAGGGWVCDVYADPVVVHCLEEGPDVNGVLVGCTDGTIRNLASGAAESAFCVVTTAAVNGGDARGEMTIGDIYIRAYVLGTPLQVEAYSSQLQQSINGATPGFLPVGTGLQPYILDFADGNGRIVNDIALFLSWPAGNDTYIDLWQPDWTELPESTQDRPTDWTDLGNASSMFIQGFTLEADTFDVPKAIAVESGDDHSLHIPDQSPVTFDGQSKQDLTFTPPFVAHSIRIVSTDGVPWRMWPSSLSPSAWAMQPFPASVGEWQTELNSLEGVGWQHIREMNIAHISTEDLTLTLTFDTGASPNQISIRIPNSGGGQAKTKVTIPRNKFKLVAFRLSSTAPFRHFQEDMECKIGSWGRTDPYRNIKPFGGPSSTGATL